MVNRPSTLTNTRLLVDERGVASQEMRSWTNEVSKQLTITGTGTPEGVIEAEVTAEYMDLSGVAGAIKYIKRNSDIGGDKTLGWILI